MNPSAVVLVALAVSAHAAPSFVAWAQRAEKGVPAGDLAIVRIDGDWLADRATAGLPPDDANRAFRDSVRDPAYGARVLPEVAKAYQRLVTGGSFRLVRIEPTTFGASALFRILASDGEFLYVHFDLDTVDGQVAIRDIRNDNTGEVLSERLRAMRLLAGARVQGDAGDALARYSGIVKLARAGKHAEVLAAYRALPAALQRERLFLRARITAATEVDPEELARALADFRARFPDDAAGAVWAHNLHLAQKRYPQVLADLDALDALVKDPYLDLQRAGIRAAQGDDRAARALLEKAIRAEPGTPQAWFTLVALLLRRREYASAADVLTRLEPATGLSIGDLEHEPIYAGFVTSPEYRTWKAKRAGRRASPSP